MRCGYCSNADSNNERTSAYKLLAPISNSADKRSIEVQADMAGEEEEDDGEDEEAREEVEDCKGAKKRDCN